MAMSEIGGVRLLDSELRELVRTATALPNAEVLTWRVEPVDYDFGTPSTEALLRVRGTAHSATNPSVDWSIFVKALCSPRHWNKLHLVPEWTRTLLIEKMPWRVDIDAQRSEVRTVLPPGLRLAEAYRIDELPDDRAVLWLEDVAVADDGWDLARFEHAAYLLGRLAARRRPELVEPFRSVPEVRTPGVGLRFYVEGRVTHWAFPAIREPAQWRDGPLAAAIAATGDLTLREDLLARAEKAAAVLDRLDDLPQTYVHGDASPQNLLVPAAEPDTFVVIDCGFARPQAIGFDLGQLLIGLAHAGELGVDELPAIHNAILPAYLAGVREDGMTVTADQVRLGYLGPLLLRAGFTALPFELLGDPLPPAWDAARLAERIRLTRLILDLTADM